MIKKVHDVLIYQRTYHKDIATRFSPREGFEDLQNATVPTAR